MMAAMRIPVATATAIGASARANSIEAPTPAQAASAHPATMITAALPLAFRPGSSATAGPRLSLEHDAELFHPSIQRLPSASPCCRGATAASRGILQHRLHTSPHYIA